MEVACLPPASRGCGSDPRSNFIRLYVEIDIETQKPPWSRQHLVRRAAWEAPRVDRRNGATPAWAIAGRRERGGGDLRQSRSGDGSGDHVGGIVHTRVDPGVRDERGGGAERNADLGQRDADAGGERGGGRRMAGREGSRPRHGDATVDRHLVAGPAGPATAGDRLEHQVDHCRAERDRREAVDGGAATAGSTGERQNGGHADPQLPVVGRPRDAAHGAVQLRGWCGGDRREDSDIEPLDLLAPSSVHVPASVSTLQSG